MRLPRFIPVLTALTTRVSGYELDELLNSPMALARALADTQKVVGHDGVLAVYDPLLLAASCVDGADLRASHAGFEAHQLKATSLRAAGEVPASRPIAAVFESLPAVRHLLPQDIQVFATFAGPGLLYGQLKGALESGSGWAGLDYVTEVIVEAVRASFEAAADGVALIEQLPSTLPEGLLRVHRKVRKLADFYNGSFLLFDQPDPPRRGTAPPAHCVFDLGSASDGCGPVMGQLDPSLAVHASTVVTTAGDVPADTPLTAVASLMHALPAA